MATNPPLDLELAPIGGKPRALREWITMFDLLLVVLDPFTNESAWLTRTAARILLHFEQADCRIAWLVTGTPDECRLFLGRWADEIMTVADPDRKVVEALGLEALPALVHIGMEGELVGVSEGWDPPEWRAISDRMAKLMSWTKPVVPLAGDPAPYQGTPALEGPPALEEPPVTA